MTSKSLFKYLNDTNNLVFGTSKQPSSSVTHLDTVDINDNGLNSTFIGYTECC